MSIKLDENYENLINWYPGHMAKGMRDIKEKADLCDLFIVVLDARCPISSYNENFDEIAPHKPRLFIITKSDLMDINKKDLITARFGNSNVLWVDLRKGSSRKKILDKITKIMKPKIDADKKKGLMNPRIKCFVVGVPNAGKSSLINLMSGNGKLKVANFPGVTKSLQWVNNGNHWFLDTPGILLPKFDDQQIGIKLCAIGSVKSEIFPLNFLASAEYKLLCDYYPNLIENLGLKVCEDDLAILNEFYNLAEIKNFRNSKNKLDLEKTYKWFIEWVKNLKAVTYD
ncbi:ribosome biogenesis GTPase YlqF [Mycoplasmopsis pullorum]|uniref:Ribosome biogenesis GTPase A n=1 Tax=Mycoplasmopsis pullorum TaxID=48003 RepID=A0A1L4FSJ3_9BACT|nr:ribosome biogenesis GTPase YlqF [Mycoplasmopsis pullorum]APJ38578.1 ribosome biogenesis GTPase YlqF [Mycoplasmopsis pullorum]